MRSLWSGSLSFGLVNIPIKLYSASDERALNFHLLDKRDLSPISYKKVSKVSGKEVEQKDIVKGYACSKDEYVVLDPDDFKRAKTIKSDLIDIVAFADEDEIPSQYYEKPYFVEPAKKAEKAYVLLRDALQQSGKVALAKFAMRDKGHIAVLKTEGNAIMLNQLRFADELHEGKDLALPKTADYSKKELDLAKSLIDSLTEKKLDLSAYKDTYVDEMKKIIRAKAKGSLKKVAGTESAPQPTSMTDILAALQKSLEETSAAK